MLLTKPERKKQVRSVSTSKQFDMEVNKRRYLQLQHHRLLRAGIDESLADKALAIWKRGVRNLKDQKVLDLVDNLLLHKSNAKSFNKSALINAAVC